jgi:hypothetical protein
MNLNGYLYNIYYQSGILPSLLNFAVIYILQTEILIGYEFKYFENASLAAISPAFISSSAL